MHSEKKRYTLTAALPYANGPVHIGHLAGCYIPADIYARYLRLRGRDVLFVCGSDEHGIPITIKARQEGVTPQQVVDKYHKIMGDAFRDFGISFDIYSRTSAEVHKKTASDFFLNLYEKGELLEKSSEEFFDPEAGEFLADRYITGTCPNCGNPEAYGDQCEKCGKSLSPDELIAPRSKLSGATPVKKPTKHWYIDLGKHQDTWLKSWIAGKKDEWKSNVYGQCMSWLGEGENKLKPRAVTRDLSWGVPVPEQVPGHEGKVLYVWFDAPIGYISATKDFFERSGDKPAWVKGESWKDYWTQEGGSSLIHFIGKDNIVFHCIIFPAMLEAHGGLLRPDNVPANEFLNLEGNKISTSRNWAVWLHEYLQEMPGREDELRYVLTSNMPETKDNDFIWKYDGSDSTTDSYQAKVNNELVNNLGNFVQRVLVLTQKYFEGKVPEASPDILDDEHAALYARIRDSRSQVEERLERYEFRAALLELMKLSGYGNQYMQSFEPWKLFATDPQKTALVLHNCIQLTAHLSVLLEPFLPKTAARLQKLLQLHNADWSTLEQDRILAAGTELGAPEHLFKRVEESEINRQLEKLEAARKASEAAKPATAEESKTVTAAKEEIQFDDFAKMDIRVGTILEAERVPKADKLLQLKVDTGVDVRTILSGIAMHYTPEQVVGRQVCVLINLAPRKMRGVESAGMILMAEDSEGKLHFVRPENIINNGADVR